MMLEVENTSQFELDHWTVRICIVIYSNWQI